VYVCNPCSTNELKKKKPSFAAAATSILTLAASAAAVVLRSQNFRSSCHVLNAGFFYIYVYMEHTMAFTFSTVFDLADHGNDTKG
jgi:hypothetical protein